MMLELAENTTGGAELFDIDCLDGYTAADDERVAKIEAILGQDRFMLHHPDDDD